MIFWFRNAFTPRTVANLVASAWIGTFQHSYEMPPRRGSSAKWVDWHTTRKFSSSPQEWRCSSLANAAEQYAWDEIILGKRKKDNRSSPWTSEECRVALASSHADIDAFCDACIQTLSWGKVGRNRYGKEDASVTWLKRARKSGLLVQEVLAAVVLLSGNENPNDNFGEALPMNSAMTKIYAFADTGKRLVIYDGRVGAALALFAMDYWHLKDGRLPAELCFAHFDSQTPGKRGSRNPSVGRYHFPTLGKHSVHAQWMWRASRILNEAAEIAKCTVLELERALLACSLRLTKTGKAMSIKFQVLIILVCAYAGWETASFQLQQLPESKQLTQEVVLESTGLTRNEETKASC
jgi:hypothetical protein